MAQTSVLPRPTRAAAQLHELPQDSFPFPNAEHLEFFARIWASAPGFTSLSVAELAPIMRRASEPELEALVKECLVKAKPGFLERLVVAAKDRDFTKSEFLSQFCIKYAPAKAHKIEARAPMDTERNIQWFREHKHDHQGQWVALSDGKLLCSSTSLHELREQIARLSPGTPPLVFPPPGSRTATVV